MVPKLAPSVETLKLGQAVEAELACAGFVRRLRAEMNEPDASRSLDLLALLSHHGSFRWVVIARPRRAATARHCVRCHRSVEHASPESGGVARLPKALKSPALETHTRAEASCSSNKLRWHR